MIDMLEIRLFMILYPSAQTLCSKETAFSLTKYQVVDLQRKMQLYHCNSSIKPGLFQISPPSLITPPYPFSGRRKLVSPPPPHPSLFILHYQIHKRWTDPVWLIHMLEVWICFDLWLQDLKHH